MSINWNKVTCEEVAPPTIDLSEPFVPLLSDRGLEARLRRNADGSLTLVEFTYLDAGDATKPTP